ncbi:cathelicidin-1-like [Anolis sagrei]|uniref:cathelicidin-1-like n=1 Tax=Anolis sagrei TaxID=38937 RepID=UPI0035218AEE
MARCWVFLLLIETVSAFNYINKPPMGYDEASKLAVQQYNLESGAEFLFRKGSTFHNNGWDPLSSQIQSFSINIQETVCKGNPETTDIDKCDFKPNGVTKSCLGSYQYIYGEVKKAKIMIICHNK